MSRGQRCPPCVRPATAQDAFAIATVSVVTWREAYRGILPADVLEGRDPVSIGRRVAEAIAGGAEYWVAELRAQIVGFASAGSSRGDAHLAEAELYAIYVVPEWHGSGVGKSLLKAIVNRMVELGMTTMCVYALRDNELARRFYVGLGAEPVEQGLHTVAGVEYPDQSFVWRSLTELQSRLTGRPLEATEQ